MIDTANGPIEYVVRGQGIRGKRGVSKALDGSRPVVLCLHGGFGGYDQGELIGSFLAHHDYVVVSPSRPGYLRTPISVGQTNAQQADAMVGLLDALGVSKVAVLGFSAGGPVAFEFALRHPDRTWALVLESIGSQPDQAPEYKLFVEILETAEGEGAVDFVSYLFYLTTKYHPRLAVSFFVSIDNTLTPPQLDRRTRYVLRNFQQDRFALKFIGR